MERERNQLEGKIAIVTGAGRGLGRTLALALAQAGADVVAAARSEAEIQETAAAVKDMGRRGLAIPTDVTDSAAVDRMVEGVRTEWGHIDILVNNAGGELGFSKPAVDLGDNEWAQVLHLNLTGAFYCVRAAGRWMIQQRYGRIINIACLHGSRGSIDHAAYAAAKGGLLQLTRALALEWATFGVTVNALGIGWLEGQQELLDQPERAERLRRGVPLNRLAHAGDAGAVVVYLASAGARYVTGAEVWVDGGWGCR